MAIQHRITDMDTLPSLALAYLGDATRWPEIADYNKLAYPYLLKSVEDLTSYFGTGYITVVRAAYQTDVIIGKGWQFKTKPNNIIGGVSKVFEVTEDTLVPANVATAYIPLRAVVPGSFGNVSEYTITEVGDNVSQLSDIQFVSVYNEAMFSGGKNLDVRITGDSLFIPTDSSEVVPEDTSKILELIAGSDLALDASGDIIFDFSGDLAVNTGADNIRYAVINRLMTELGELTLHPDYGTEVRELIGRPNISNREKLMAVAVIRSLSQESLITDVSIDSLSIEGTSAYMDISYKEAISNNPGSVQLKL